MIKTKGSKFGIVIAVIFLFSSLYMLKHYGMYLYSIPMLLVSVLTIAAYIIGYVERKHNPEIDDSEYFVVDETKEIYTK